MPTEVYRKRETPLSSAASSCTSRLEDLDRLVLCLGLSGGPGGLSSSLFFGEMPCLDLILIPSKLVSSSSSSSSRVSEVERGELGEGRERGEDGDSLSGRQRASV